MNSTADAAGHERLTERLLFLLVLLASCWFFSVGSWNQNSRYDAIFAFWENEGGLRHTFAIDRYIVFPEFGVNTGDWSRYGGHYYSNKSPGTSILGALAYGPMYLLERCFVKGDFAPGLDLLNAWILNLLLSGLPLAFGAVFFRRILLRAGCSSERAGLFSFLMVFGTGMWPYTTQLWALPATGAFLILSLYFYSEKAKLSVYASGFFFGLAVLFDYSAAMMIPAVGTALLVAAWPDGYRKMFRFILGGLPLALLYFWYNKLCFGGFLQFAFMHQNPEFVDAGRTGGVAALPNLQILLELLIGQYRGIFPAMPFLVFAVPGFLFLWKSGGEKRRLALLVSACSVSLLLMNASFNGWHGGYAILPRYLIPSFPALVLLAAFSPLERRGTRAVFALCAVLSVCNMLAVTVNSPITRGEDRAPLYRTAYKTLTDSTSVFGMETLKLYLFHPEKERILRESTTSFGERAGLPRYASWICMALLLGVLAAGILLTKRAKEFLREDLAYWKDVFSRNTFRFDLWNILLISGLLLLFLLPGSIPFVNDEPKLLEMAWKCNLDNTFATHSLQGTAGFVYGPPAVILYQLFLMLAPTDLVLITILKTALSILPVLLAFRAVFRGPDAPDWRLPLLLLLCSPFFYFYSRNLWDNVFLIPLSALILWFVYRYSRTGAPADAAALCLCFLISLLIHPMSAPLALAFGLWLIFVRRDLLRKHFIFLTAAAFACAGLFAAFLACHYVPGTSQTEPGFSLRALCQWTLNPFRGMSFDGFYPYFFPDAAKLYPGLVVSGRILAVLSLVFFLIFFAFGVRHLVKNRTQARVNPAVSAGLFALAAIPVHILLFMFFMKQVYPHYAMSLFIPCTLIASFGVRDLLCLRGGGMVVRTYFCTMFLGVLCTICLLERNGGTMGLEYGPMLKNQLAVVRDIKEKSVHSRHVSLRMLPWHKLILPRGIGFLFDFEMKNNPPLRDDAVKTKKTLPVVIGYSGPVYSGFIRAFYPEEKEEKKEP